MLRLNEQFMDAIADPDGKLKVERRGYSLLEHKQDGVEVEIGLNPWMEPFIYVGGSLALRVLNGGVSIFEGDTFQKRGLHGSGLHLGFDDSFGDRRYLITDTPDEAVKVSFWDPNANTPDPSDGFPGGQYGDYAPVPEADAVLVKELARGVIEAGKIAVDAQLAHNA